MFKGILSKESGEHIEKETIRIGDHKRSDNGMEKNCKWARARRTWKDLYAVQPFRFSRVVEEIGTYFVGGDDVSDKTKIEWTDRVWNPVTGCTKVSAGCANCYAERFAGRGMGAWKGRKFSEVLCHPERLDAPLHWRKPCRVFVNSMSDLFHPSVPFSFIAEIFERMSWGFNLTCKKKDCECECEHDPERFSPDDEECKCWTEIAGHAYQILTKRPERALKFFRWLDKPDEQGSENSNADRCCPTYSDGIDCQKNIWLGVSVEYQKTADERIPLLLQTPAAVRFVSCEPLLGPADLAGYYLADRCGGRYPFPSLAEEHRTKRINLLDWVIVGGETGPGARPMNPDWARSIRDQCQSAGVPFFFKGWGEWGDQKSWESWCEAHNTKSYDWPDNRKSGDRFRVGKKYSGRMLDGRTWEEFPNGKTIEK